MNESARRVIGMVLRAGLAAPITDAQLLEEFTKNRAAEAFAEIVRRHGSMVFGVCRRVLGHEQDAEDAFQATFLVLARKAAAIRPLAALGRWLYGVAFRTAQKARTRRHRQLQRDAILAAQSQPSAAASSAPPDWLPLLDQELNRLSERERLPIVLCDLLGRSRKEAAEELGLPEGTISSRLARGRDRLRRRLERRGVVPAITAAGVALETYPASAALVDSTMNLTTAAATSAVTMIAQGVIRAMILKSTAKTFVLLAGILLFGGVGLLWSLSPSNQASLQNTSAPNAAVAPTEKDTANQDNKPEEKKNQPGDPKDGAAKADAEPAKPLMERLKGTWKVVYSEGRPPAVKLPAGGMLQKPMFFLFDNDKLTWDNGNANDPVRLARFQMKTDERSIDISLGGTFQIGDVINGGYNLTGDRLLITWDIFAGAVWEGDGKTWAGGVNFFPVILQRVESNDLQAAAKQKAAEAPDLRLLHGQWRIAQVQGDSDDIAVKVGYRFFFQDGRLKIIRGDVDDVLRPLGPFFLETGVNPKQIVFLNQDIPFGEWNSDTRGGIYRIDKDRLEICWRIGNQDGKQKLPNKFEIGNDSKLQLISLERVDAAADKPADAKTRLTDLQKALAQTLQRQVDGLQARSPKGSDSTITVLQAYQRLMEAQLELAADKKSRIQVMEATLERLQTFEQLKFGERQAGRSPAHELAQIKANRLMAQILLEKEKRVGAAVEKADGAKTRLMDLQKATVEALQQQVDGLEARLRQGRDSTITVLDAYQRLMEAQLELAADKKSRIQVAESILQRLIAFEQLKTDELQAGKSTAFELAQCKAKTLMVEIFLERLKRVDAAAETPAEAKKLIGLQKELVEALQQQVDGLLARFQAGKDSTITILEARERLMEAQLDLAKDKKRRIQIIETSLPWLLLHERLKAADLQAGKSPAHELAQVKAERLLAQIRLEKEKGNSVSY